MSNSLQLIKKYIKESLQQRPFYDSEEMKVQYLSNHYYMCLIALSRMNATTEQIESFREFYLAHKDIQKLKESYDPDFITYNNFDENIGKYEKFEEYFSFFKKESKEKGVKQVLAEYIPKLSQGLCSEAFHCLIQLGYAIDWEFQEEEILHAVAYLALQNALVAEKSNQVDVKDPFTTLSELKSLKPYFKEATTFKGPALFNDKVNLINKNEKFLSIIPKNVKFSEKLIDDLQLAVLKMFAEGEDFIILHAVSGITCLRQLLPYIKEEDKQKVFDDFMRHLFAGYACSDFMHKSEEEIQKKLVLPEQLPSWTEIFAKANLSTDDHDIKFVYICSIEAKHYGDESEHGKYSRYGAALRMNMVKGE